MVALDDDCHYPTNRFASLATDSCPLDKMAMVCSAVIHKASVPGNPTTTDPGQSGKSERECWVRIAPSVVSELWFSRELAAL